MPFERAIIQNMLLPDQLKVVVEMDLPSEIFPTEALRPVYDFIVDYWHAESYSGPPSPEAILLHFSNVLAEEGIDVTIEPEDSLTWALEAIEGAYVRAKIQEWIRPFAAGTMSEDSDILQVVSVLDKGIDDLMRLQSTFTKRSEHVDVRVAARVHLEEYTRRAESTADLSIIGARFGLPEIDEHTGGIRPSEIGVLAAPPKTGKSFELAWGAYETWRCGGTPVLFTLENSVEMTMDRLACMVNGIDAKRWERGLCTPQELAIIQAWVEEMAHQERPFHVLQPESGKRTMQQLIRRARSLGDSIFLDQLTFVEINPGEERRPRTEQIRSMLHDAKANISGGVRIPLVAAAQINRDGVEYARKKGYLEMNHLAESSEIERTADYVFGLWQSAALRDVGRAWWQSLAARRKDLLHWEIAWQPYIGQIAVRNRVELPD